MVYGAEAVLPSDIRHWVAAYVEAVNEEHVRMLLMRWMRSVTLQRLVRRYTSKIYVSIIATGLRPGPFKKAIWCSG